MNNSFGLPDRTINELYQDAEEARVQKARLYVRTGRTKIEKILAKFYLFCI